MVVLRHECMLECHMMIDGKANARPVNVSGKTTSRCWQGYGVAPYTRQEEDSRGRERRA